MSDSLPPSPPDDLGKIDERLAGMTPEDVYHSPAFRAGIRFGVIAEWVPYIGAFFLLLTTTHYARASMWFFSGLGMLFWAGMTAARFAGTVRRWFR